MDWRHQAACRGMDVNLFFPPSYKAPAVLGQVEEARSVCRRCPVRATCLEWAVNTGQGDGIWGGLIPDERPRAKRRPRSSRRRPARVDEVVVERAAEGKPVGRALSDAEQAEAARLYVRRTGQSVHGAALLLHTSYERLNRVLEATA